MFFLIVDYIERINLFKLYFRLFKPNFDIPTQKIGKLNFENYHPYLETKIWKFCNFLSLKQHFSVVKQSAIK